MKTLFLQVSDMKLNFLDRLHEGKLWLVAIFLQIQPINDFISKYVFSDFTFLKSLAIAMILDLVTGIVKAWSRKEPITSRGLRGTVTKCVQYGAFLIITHVLTNYEIGGQKPINFQWLNKLAFEFIILIEIKSVYENIVAINPKLDLFDKVVKKIAEFIKSEADTKNKK